MKGSGENVIMEWLTELSEIGLPAIIGILVGLFGFVKGVEAIYKWSKDKFLFFYNKKNNSDKLVKNVDKHEKDICDINSKIDGLLELIIQQDEQNKKIDCALLRDRIVQSYKHHKETGKISALDYENLKELFVQYFARGGNHLVSNIYEDFKTWTADLEEGL